ncbi:MAG TPA: dihydrodipicolinate synthase family protein [Planctomycetota bacterium]|nr:dihydrodipicolinate synthase family protein [Planctomycetota bacterium]
MAASDYPVPPNWVTASLRKGLVIPAHPLALTRARKFDERRQRALTCYYHAAGAGGVAVGVHTTQFDIRNPKHGLYNPVLTLASETVSASDAASGRKTVLIAGICGRTAQACAEARFANELDYHAGLLSLAALKNDSDDALIAHCKAVAREIPLFGFYLQPAAGGRLLSHRFWRRFVEIPNVVAIKMAPFNRYQTLDVVRAVAESGRADEIALYTGNDDHIVGDLITEYAFKTARGTKKLRIVGGLLGHWACWTRAAVEVLEKCKNVYRRRPAGTGRRDGARTRYAELLTLNEQVTDCNAAFFDAANGFAGCIPGIHEVLRRQGLLENVCCLNPNERLSPGQAAEISRVYRAYPQLNDDAFVKENLDTWLK